MHELFIEELNQVTGGRRDPEPSSGNRIYTTQAIGEEDGGPTEARVTTQALGEEDGLPGGPIWSQL